MSHHRALLRDSEDSRAPDGTGCRAGGRQDEDGPAPGRMRGRQREPTGAVAAFMIAATGAVAAIMIVGGLDVYLHRPYERPISIGSMSDRLL
jgi:hypothetical protein